MFVSCECFVL